MATSGYYTYNVVQDNAIIVKCDPSISGQITIPSSLGGYSVTRLAGSSFAHCTQLTKVTIPGCIKSIGDYAFRGCTSLATVIIPGSVKNIGYYAFSSCTSLVNLTIKEGVEIIDDWAFEKCSQLKNINLPNGLKNIGEWAFSYCTSLTNIMLPNCHINIGECAFLHTGYYNDLNNWENNALYINSHLIKVKSETVGSYNIKKETITIAEAAFSNCRSLTSVTIPNSIMSISDLTFFYCTNLTSIIIPYSVTNIGKRAFDGCSSLVEVYYSGNEETTNEINILEYNEKLLEATWIYSVVCGDWRYLCVDKENKTACIVAYEGENVIGITIPNTLDGYKIIEIDTQILPTSIKILTLSDYMVALTPYNFSNLVELQTVNLGAGLLDLGESAFANTKISSITIPKQVNQLSIQSFLGMTTLQEIIVDENNQDYSSFNGVLFNKDKSELICCPAKIIDYEIPYTVITIGQKAFCNCINLTSVTIPNSVTTINSFAFLGCVSLVEVYYFGSEEQKNSTLYINEGNEPLENTTWIYGYVYGDWRYICIDEENKTGRVISYEGTDTTIIIPETLGEGKDEHSIIEIDPNALKNTQVISVTISKSVENLSAFIFMDINTLQEIIVNSDNKNYYTENGVLFNKDKNMLIFCPAKLQKEDGTYEISDAVVTIGENAFRNCTVLTNIIIPNSVTTIEDEAFRNCTNLTDIKIPDSIKDIGDYAFGNCIGLTSIKIPNGVSYIGRGVFYNCSSLNSVIIPDSIKSIGREAFRECKELQRIDLHNVTYIESEAFLLLTGEAQSWDYINLNANANVSLDAFKGREQLIKCVYFGGNQIVFENNIKDQAIKSIVQKFYNGVRTEEWEVQDNKLTNYFGGDTKIVIPQIIWGVSISTIGFNCFIENKVVQEITVQDNITDIETNAFKGCINLTNISLGNNLKNIGVGALMECEKMNKLVLSNSLETIESKAFYGCINLSNITIGDNVGVIGEQAFYNTAYYEDLNNWNNGLLILHGNQADYLIELKEECVNENKEINLERLDLKLIASGCMDINAPNHEFITEIKTIRLPFHLERINKNAINLNNSTL